MIQTLFAKKVLHYPKLDTILLVEEFIRDHSGEFKKKSLWSQLPKKMMYQTYCVIFSYLEYSGKIARDTNGTIAWIWNPTLVAKYSAKPELRWRKPNPK